MEEKRVLLIGLLTLLLGLALGVTGDSLFSIASFQWSFTRRDTRAQPLISQDTYVLMRITSYVFISVGQIIMTAGILITSFVLYSIGINKKNKTEKWYNITLAVMATLLLIFAFKYVISNFLQRWIY